VAQMKPKMPYEEQASASAQNPRVAKRAKILLGIGALLFSLLLLRIFLYQTVDYDRYQKKVIEQMTTEAQVAAARGNIYDVNGVLLATNVTTYRIFISPSSIAAAQIEHNQNSDGVQLNTLIAQNLSSILDVSYDFVLKQTEYTAYLDRTIQRKVGEEQADQVRAFIDRYGLQKMVYLQATNTRYYPYSNLASHVLGFTGSDGTGLYGLEFSYNTLLKGTNGRYITARDARGNEMPYEYKEYIEPTDGYHLHTTIDVFVQSALEEQLKSTYIESKAQNRAAGVVMDVNTGAILGMAVYPDFDLNDPWTLDEQSLYRLNSAELVEGSDAYEALKQELLLNMWSNKALTESYIPGSTFKIITASMALEEDVVELNESFSCVGYKEVSGFKIHCNKTNGHGSLSFVQGIQQSCNPVFMTVGERIGATNFYKYLKSFGFTERTGIDLSGEGMSLFAAEENFTKLDLAIYAFGQNFNVTLMQQITAISAVANGGYLVSPHIVSSVTDSDGNIIQSVGTNVKRQIISAETCKTVAKSLLHI
jgi:stage V sporulation protein D (sporulation-specific penicillin-binding protein)